MSTVLILLLMAYTLIEPQVSINGATAGLLLWFNKVLPTLLPFIILSQLLFKLGLIFKLEQYIGKFSNAVFGVSGSSLITFVLGSIGGSPTGAKLTNQLLQQPNISTLEAQKTLCFSNNTGPLFIIGTVGTLMLQDVRLGYFLVIVHILSALIILVLSRFYSTYSPVTVNSSNKEYSQSPAFVTAFTDSVQGGMDTIVYVGGFIIFFSMLISIIKNLALFNALVASLSNMLGMDTIILESLLLGSMEFSNGSAYITQFYTGDAYILAILSAILGFGGFCVFFQTAHILSSTKLSLGVYLIAKTVQAVFAALLTIAFFPTYNAIISKSFIAFDIPAVIAIAILFAITALGLKATSSKLYGVTERS
ncbi:MAG: hypothetical protein ATN34_04630 [Epulopiscium sp. Nele67-Bin002]|nr:MAG: hypothetical protein BEN18_08000 [Epulopiscium sp. Nuni2H_MBin001]OON91933.1 MAG: hypothetical protein ATN34_04630 [Epulopiscium sp. Nele67-Bin002]